jgi:hypothetical protein
VKRNFDEIIDSIATKFHSEFIHGNERTDTKKIAILYTSFILLEYLKLMEERDDV